MKKLIRVSTIPTSLNTFCRGQLKMLSAHFEVIALSSPGEELDQLGTREQVRTIAVPMERHISLWKDFVSLCRLIHVFYKERPYIVHSMTPKAGLLSMVAAWVTRVPVRIHTFTGLVFPTAHGLMQRILMLMDGITCFCATHINPEGQGVKRDLERFSITCKPLHIIANGNVRGIDLQYYDRTPQVIAAAETLKQPSCFTFCFVGRIVADKGINELVEAFCKLYEENPAVRLLLVGRYEEDLNPLEKNTISIIHTCTAIEHVGQQADVRPYMAASDALVFPSYREGFPNVVLEAGAMGLPVIVTDINGSNEIIENEKNGLIIPPKDTQALFLAMKEFATNSTLVQNMARNTRQIIADRYEQKMIWGELLAWYQSLCKDK